MPGPKVALVYARAPSTLSCPPETTAVPPAAHAAEPQSAGSVAPENSCDSCDGLSDTAPSPSRATTVFASAVPRLKSAAVTSVGHGAAVVVKLSVAGGAGDVAGLPLTSTEVTR